MTAPGVAVTPRGGIDAVARWVAIAAVEAIIAIHLVLTPMHLREAPYIGVLFIVGNVLLFVALLAMAGRRRQGTGWSLAALVCAGELVGFVLSRTTGLPMGYHEAWASAPEDYLGLLSLGCEAVFFVAAVTWRRARSWRH